MRNLFTRRRFLEVGTPVVPLYDNVSAMYTLRQPPMTNLWDKEVLKLRRSSDNDQRFVFFDDDGKISLASSVSGAGDLLAWIGSNDAFVTEWIGIDGTNTVTASKTAIQNTSANQPKFIDNGVIITKNSEAAIDFLNDVRYLEAPANTDLDSGNNHTTLIVSANTGGSLLGALIGTKESTTTGGNRYTVFNDNRPDKRIGSVVSGGVETRFDYLVRENTVNQKLLTTISNIVDENLTAYYNGDIQEQVSWNGSYDNDILTIGVQINALSAIEGNIQEIIIFPSDKTADLTVLNTDINDYYTIY